MLEPKRAMRTRGAHWLALGRTLETPIPAPRAPRPSPAPPVDVRPRKLSVTRIKHLIRDPYAIYAQYVLGLKPLNPLQRAPDALMRGVVVHEVMESFLKQSLTQPETLTSGHLLALTRQRLMAEVPFPTMRHLWQARVARAADWFVATEAGRQARATPHAERLEIKGASALNDLDFTLTATADRIDLDEAGRAVIYDYKTGAPPSADAQRYFDKQLLLEAAMVEAGGFDLLGPCRVAYAAYIGLAPSPVELAAPLDQVTPTQVWQQFHDLIRAYSEPEKGYTARRAMLKETDVSDYDHLARYGEWDTSEPPHREVLK